MTNILNFPKVRTAKINANKVALTETRIEKLPTSGATYYLHDERQPGLSVRVSSAGVKAFVFTKKTNRRLLRITLGRCGALRLDDARQAAKTHHGNLAKGIDVGAVRKAAKAAPKVMTMEEAFQAFLSAKERRDSTVADYKRVWRRHIPAWFKRYGVADITSADIDGLKKAVGDAHRTANKVVVLIGAILAKSGRWADNPTRGVGRYQEKVRTRRLNADELSRVWTALNAEPEWGDFFKLLILTGSRKAAFCAMRWEQIDLAAGAWLCPAVWSKNKSEMAIPLSVEAIKILTARSRRHGNKSSWVWRSEFSDSGHIVNPEKPWRRILKVAKVDLATLHDIRRTLGSRLAMDGVAGPTISKVLGHVSSQSLKAYAHLDIGAGAKAIDRVMKGLTGGRNAS